MNQKGWGRRQVLLAGRMALGLAIGVTSATVPMYVAETAPPHVRGALVTANDLMICGGQVSAPPRRSAIRTSLKELLGRGAGTWWSKLQGVPLSQVAAGVVNLCMDQVPHGWRWAMGLAAVPAILQLLGLQALPESPRFLMRKRSRTHAAAALQMLRNPSWDVHAEVCVYVCKPFRRCFCYFIAFHSSFACCP
jgi:MFS family permease